jgi:hypothetical protein
MGWLTVEILVIGITTLLVVLHAIASTHNDDI